VACCGLLLLVCCSVAVALWTFISLPNRAAIVSNFNNQLIDSFQNSHITFKKKKKKTQNHRYTLQKTTVFDAKSSPGADFPPQNPSKWPQNPSKLPVKNTQREPARVEQRMPKGARPVPDQHCARGTRAEVSFIFIYMYFWGIGAGNLGFLWRFSGF
jgi:hypothetical protein